MRVDVLVVVAMRQFAEALIEALAAGVVFAGLTVAVSAPVSDGLRDRREKVVIRVDGASLSHGHMVGRIEGAGGDVTKGPGEFGLRFRTSTRRVFGT